MSNVRMTGNWSEFARTLGRISSPQLWKASSSKAMGKEAHRLRNLIVKGFNSQGSSGTKWKKLSRLTVALRKAMGFSGTKALMRTGDLRNSIKARKEGEDWFTGVHRKEKSRDGKRLVNIAMVHEFGSKKPIKIVVTEKLRKFFMAMFLKSTTPAQRKKLGRGKMPKYAVMPLSQSKRVIITRIRKRPFIGPVWNSEKDKSSKNIIRDTMRGVGLGRFIK